MIGVCTTDIQYASREDSTSQESPRPSWHEYFTELAVYVSSRSTCRRLKVGCVIVKDRNIIATGYNGSMSGLPHCSDANCVPGGSSCTGTVHAEVNAIAQAAKNGGGGVNGSTVYCTHEPCWNCYKMLVNSGVKSIYFLQSYGCVSYPEAPYVQKTQVNLAETGT